MVVQEDSQVEEEADSLEEEEIQEGLDIEEDEAEEEAQEVLGTKVVALVDHEVLLLEDHETQVLTVMVGRNNINDIYKVLYENTELFHLFAFFA